ncbi:MAG: putative DNA binding domain-containing protein [Chloroflexi bacterium]|nr:putative DNA binding domain-containing protein [Chloroflexota bacterium]
MGKKHGRANYQWYVLDTHIHTPASSDYQQPDVTYLDILQRAEARGLDMIAFTDHNTVAGYRRMQDEIHQLNLLEGLNRLLPDERAKLNEYRRLLSRILVLPGVEVTATFGFHIIGLFSPTKPLREIDHLLLSLNIPADQLDDGSATVGATSDVLTVYRLIRQAGGIVIAAHANSSNGVAMRGFNFGGQTKIAYTQDSNLHALEVTDLEQTGRRTTAAFFDGTKPEYPRRMHCIQGSDAHRLTTDSSRKKNPGIGDRATDALLPEVTFEALMELFESNDFARTRPHRRKEEPVYDFIQVALEEGPNIIQDFHESMTVRGGKLYAIIADVCAFANTNGGTLYIGLSNDPKKPPIGVPEPEQATTQLDKEISNRISPSIQCTIDIHEMKGKKILRVLVPRGEDPPYAVDDNKIYVRDEAETGLAVRDEIVGLVLRGAKRAPEAGTVPAEILPEEKPSLEEVAIEPDLETDISPHTGVEVLPPEDRGGARYYTMRDLRNGNKVKNVTRASARRLWHYAIDRYMEISGNLDQAVSQWQGDLGMTRRYKQGKKTMYDLVQRTPSGYRFYFGVTPDGIHGPWKSLAGDEEA